MLYVKNTLFDIQQNHVGVGVGVQIVDFYKFLGSKSLLLSPVEALHEFDIQEWQSPVN